MRKAVASCKAIQWVQTDKIINLVGLRLEGPLSHPRCLRPNPAGKFHCLETFSKDSNQERERPLETLIRIRTLLEPAKISNCQTQNLAMILKPDWSLNLISIVLVIKISCKRFSCLYSYWHQRILKRSDCR